MYRQSSLRKVALETGDVLQIRNLPDNYFGEGITLFGDRIIQLTWKSRSGFVYDKETFDLTGEFQYPTEGWGITTNGTHLIMSDGSSRLYFLDPNSYEEINRIEVLDGDKPVTQLNELEYIDGQIHANVWQTDTIAIISPQDGRVTGWIDLEGLLNRENLAKPANVLNGIARDPRDGSIWVTGKRWPWQYHIETVPAQPNTAH